MRKRFLATIALSCVLSYMPQTVSAQAVSISSIPSKVFDLGKNILSSLKDESKFCQKANLFGRTISIRSLDGNICLLSPFARIAEVRCRNNPNPAIANDFKGSACDTKIARAYGNRTAAQALKEDIPRLPTPLRIAYCAQAHLIKDPLVIEVCTTYSTTANNAAASTAVTSKSAGEPSEPASAMPANPAKPMSAFDRSIAEARQREQAKVDSQ